MQRRIINTLPAVSFIAALAIGSVSLVASPKETWSLSERRPLASAPVLSGKTIMDGSWFGELDGWMADHFVNREEFRHLRMLFQTKMLREHEYNGFIEYNGYLINLQKEINEDSVGYAAERFGYVFSSTGVIAPFSRSYILTYIVQSYRDLAIRLNGFAGS